MTEEADANDEIVRAVKFEEEWLSRLQCAELDVAARLPKVDFVQVGDAGQMIEPIAICDANKEAQTSSRSVARIINESSESGKDLTWL